MKAGISTASLYGKMYTEQALDFFNKNGVECAEVFLSSFSEYTPEFAKTLKSVQGNVDVYSIHTLNSQFEGQLFSHSDRQYIDALKIFENALNIGQELGARVYVMHGPAQMKYTKYVTDYPFFGERTAILGEKAQKRGITLTWENVHWAHYNHPDFFRKLLKYVNGSEIGTTLDIKQAIQSDCTIDKYIADMDGHIKNIHIVDFDADGRLTMPGKGCFDYAAFFSAAENPDCPVMIEVYDGCYKSVSELLQSYRFLQETICKCR